MPPRPNVEARAEVGVAGAYPARVPLLRAAAVQVAAALACFILITLARNALPMKAELMSFALLQGVVAAGLGRLLGMEVWWLPIHAMFAPALVWALGLALPPVYALAAFCLLASLFWGVSRTRVPLFLSSHAAAQAVAELLPRERSFSFVDLGCGLGGVLASLARTRPAGRYHGIESAPVPFLLSWLRAALAAQSCRISWGNCHDLDLSRYDIVYAYLSPAAMPELWQKARREMRPGALLISNSFAVPGVPPHRTVATGARVEDRLLLWRM